ncbi:hypothetical protein Lumi_099 [Xylophilus phage Lumi]|nr:hypothetical protein Lumi_099 [Xylophilus phage Lumi]
MSVLLTSKDDLDWCFDVHLKEHKSIRPEVKAIYLNGTEDAPEFLDCYDVAEPLFNGPIRWKFVQDEEGNLKESNGTVP